MYAIIFAALKLTPVKRTNKKHVNILPSGVVLANVTTLVTQNLSYVQKQQTGNANKRIHTKKGWSYETNILYIK